MFNIRCEDDATIPAIPTLTAIDHKLRKIFLGYLGNWMKTTAKYVKRINDQNIFVKFRIRKLEGAK